MLFDDVIGPKGNRSILSWDDQIHKGEAKVIEPKSPPPKEEKVKRFNIITYKNILKSNNHFLNIDKLNFKKLKPERFLIVKKLSDEEEFKPKLKKSPLESKEYQMIVLQHQRQARSSMPLDKQADQKHALKPGVEIVGLGNSLLNRTNTKTNPEGSSDEQSFAGDDLFYINNTSTDQHQKFKTLAPAKKSTKQPILSKEESTLNDQSYLQIIDNLTFTYNSKISISSANIFNSKKNLDDANIKELMTKDKSNLFYLCFCCFLKVSIAQFSILPKNSHLYIFTTLAPVSFGPLILFF